MLERAGINYWTVQAEGSDPLSHTMSTVYIGSWVSYYLAIIMGIDPSPTPVIDYWKQRQKKESVGTPKS